MTSWLSKFRYKDTLGADVKAKWPKDELSLLPIPTCVSPCLVIQWNRLQVLSKLAFLGLSPEMAKIGWLATMRILER